MNKKYLDKKLYELQEGPVLIAFGILVALLAGGAAIEHYKVERILRKYKEKIDSLLEQAKKNNISKIFYIGNSLSKIIQMKYSFIYPKYYYDKTSVNKWKTIEYYEESVPTYFRGFTSHYIKFKGKKSYEGFFYLYINSDSIEEKYKKRIQEEDRSMSQLIHQANNKVTQIISQDINRIITFLKPLLTKEK